MSVRFVNDKAYDQDWFRKIGSNYRDVWWFLWLRIHPIGIWAVEPDLVEMYTKVEPFKVKDFIEACNSGNALLADQSKERVVMLPDGRHVWFVYYVITQHPKGLLNTNPATKHIPDLLREHNLLDRVLSQYADRKIICQTEIASVKSDITKAEEEAFELVWKAYPHKVNKVNARKAFHNVVGNEHPQMVPLILADLARRVKGGHWKTATKEDIHYIVHMERYLSKRRWEDVLPAGGAALSKSDYHGAFTRRTA